MKLARKLTWFLITGIFATLALHAFLRIQREAELFETDIQRDHGVLARALAAALATTWQVDGEARALALLHGINAQEPGISARLLRVEDGRIPQLGPSLKASDVEAILGRSGPVHLTQCIGRSTLCTYFGVTLDGKSTGVLEITESLKPRDDYVRATVVGSALTALNVAIVASVLAAMLGVWLIGRPMQTLVSQARRIGAGDLSQRVVLTQKDEVGELAREINLMCDRLDSAHHELKRETLARIQAFEQLRHADRLITVGRLASGIAHELGTPLNVVSGRAKLISKDPTATEDILKQASSILEQSERMARIIRQLLDFARAKQSHKTPTDLRGMAAQAAAMLEPLAAKSRIKLELHTPEQLPELAIDRGQIQQVLTNLIVNAVQATQSPGTVGIQLGERHASAPGSGSEARYLCIEVEDRGSGMSEQTLEHIFEPFFTTKEVGEGTGLGLSVAHGIVEEHGGFIEVESSLGKGSRFRVCLPVSAQQQP